MSYIWECAECYAMHISSLLFNSRCVFRYVKHFVLSIQPVTSSEYPSLSCLPSSLANSNDHVISLREYDDVPAHR
jgi:hypothetical protein